MCKLTKRKKGFTLIELLVVIAIIAILAAILFPVLMSVKEKARQTSCSNNMHQIGTAFRLYLADWNGRYPGGGPRDDLTATGQWMWLENGKACPRKGAIFPYVKSTKTYICPSDVFEKKTHFGLSYSMNAYLAPEFGGTRLTESQVSQPTKTVLLIDEGAGTSDGKNPALPIVDGYFGAWQDVPQDVHVGGCNFVFL